MKEIINIYFETSQGIPVIKTINCNVGKDIGYNKEMMTIFICYN